MFFKNYFSVLKWSFCCRKFHQTFHTTIPEVLSMSHFLYVRKGDSEDGAKSYGQSFLKSRISLNKQKQTNTSDICPAGFQNCYGVPYVSCSSPLWMEYVRRWLYTYALYSGNVGEDLHLRDFTWGALSPPTPDLADESQVLKLEPGVKIGWNFWRPCWGGKYILHACEM